MPLFEGKSISARDSQVKRLATERNIGLELFEFEQKMRRMGADADWRRAEFDMVRSMKLDALSAFFNRDLARL